MNYGYDSMSPSWKEDRKHELARKLSQLLIDWGVDGPYIEIDGFYSGVRIRRLTALCEEDRDNLTTCADAIYSLVMNHQAVLPPTIEEFSEQTAATPNLFFPGVSGEKP